MFLFHFYQFGKLVSHLIHPIWPNPFDLVYFCVCADKPGRPGGPFSNMT